MAQKSTSTIQQIDYRVIFEKTPELYLLLEPNPPEYTILDASDAYLKATLTQRHEIIGKGLFTVFPENPDDLVSKGTSNLKLSLETAMREKKMHVMAVQKYDVPLPPGQGKGFEEKYWNPRNTPVMDEQDNILYILHQAEDVTNQMVLDNQRKIEIYEAGEMLTQKSMIIKENEERINFILDALLRFTTMDFSFRINITEKGDEFDAIGVGLNSLIDELEHNLRLLRQSNEALEYANKELDSFSYSVSHDLRAPLRGINGYAQVLLEDYADKLDEDGIRNIHVIMRNALRMGNLIDDLLTFSRVGKQYISKVPLNMNAIVNSVIAEISSGNDISTNFEIKPLANVEGDSAMITQVITNLVSNAVKYSSKKEQPFVEIGCYPEEHKMVYYVKDNGAGFDMKYYDKLFGVFQRLHGPEEFEGTGVGLALVQRILKKHHGDVSAESAPNQGATFKFWLPVN